LLGGLLRVAERNDALCLANALGRLSEPRVLFGLSGIDAKVETVLTV